MVEASPPTARGQSIAILHYAGPPVVGGVESVMRHHAELLAQAGHRVKILAGRAEAWRDDISVETLELLDSLHPEILSIKASLDSAVVPEQFQLMSERIQNQLHSALAGVDVVIAHNICTMAKNLPFSAALRAICSGEQAPRLIAWHHDLAWRAERYKDELHPGYPWSLLTEPWNECSPSHVAVSTLRKEQLCTLQGLNESEIQVIPSGVHSNELYALDETADTLSRMLNLEDHFPLFLLPVRITKRKNIEYAIEIIAALRDTFPKAALLVTGPPGAHNKNNSSYFDTLRKQRDALGLGGGEQAAVYFLAEAHSQRLSDETISSFFRLCDALLMPSTEEGFGIPIIEAGLSGMPVFCSDIAPFREIAGELAHFFTLDQSASETASAIAQALREYTFLNLKQNVRSEYTWRSVYQKHIAPLLLENRPAVAATSLHAREQQCSNSAASLDQPSKQLRGV